MYGLDGPPGHHGNEPSDPCALRSLARASSRWAAAIFGSSTFTSRSVRPPRASISQGVSSSAIFRFGSVASQVSSSVVRDAASFSAIFAMAGYRLNIDVRMAVETKRLRVCSVHS